MQNTLYSVVTKSYSKRKLDLESLPDGSHRAVHETGVGEQFSGSVGTAECYQYIIPVGEVNLNIQTPFLTLTVALRRCTR